LDQTCGLTAQGEPAGSRKAATAPGNSSGLRGP